MPDEHTAGPNETPRRRWFQFRLRKILIGLVLFGVACGYVAREATRIKSRCDILVWLDARTTYMPFYDKNPDSMKVLVVWGATLDDSRLPWLRRTLGDHFVREIKYGKDATPDELERIRANFPEAEIVEFPMPAR
jgi:hypothetical protein